MARKYFFNEQFFDEIDVESKAYWLGFIAGDGYIRGNVVTLQLAAKDAEHLVKLRDAIGSSAPVRIFTPKIVGQQFPSAVFYICSRHMVAALASHGILNCKSLTIKPWVGSDSLMRHFWRGLVDADGNIGKMSVNLLGSKWVIDGFANFVQGHIETKATPAARENVWSYTVRGRHIARELVSLLYGDAEVALARKAEAASWLVKYKPARKPRGPMTIETKEKLSRAMKGRIPDNLSLLHTPEIIAKRSKPRGLYRKLGLGS